MILTLATFGAGVTIGAVVTALLFFRAIKKEKNRARRDALLCQYAAETDLSKLTVQTIDASVINAGELRMPEHLVREAVVGLKRKSWWVRLRDLLDRLERYLVD